MKRQISIIISLLASLCAMAQIDSIDANSRIKELQGVVIEATKPLTKFDVDGIVTTITGTPLQALGTVDELLRYIPGIISNNGSIEVVGKGCPVIYINGRKLVNHSELAQISTTKVKNIKVITNPGARYDGSTNAVVRISTVREIGDGFSLDSRATLGIRDYFYDKGQLNINYRTGGLDIFGFFEHNNNRSKGIGQINQNLWGSKRHSSHISMNAHKRSQLMEGKVGFNYVTESGHSFGVFYQNVYEPGKGDLTSNSNTAIDEIIQNGYDVLSYNRNKYYEHLIDGYYSGNWGRWIADIAFDFLWRNSKDRQQINETVVGQSVTDFNMSDNNHGQMLAGELNLTRPIWNGSLDLGATYTNTKRKDGLISEASLISSNNNQVKESNVGVYGQLIQRLGKVILQIGLRYEHVSSKYYELGKNMPEQSGSSNELLPSASLVVPVKSSTFQLGYSRKYSRPLYSQLSRTVYYMNQNNYETGNPNLKNTFIDNVSLNFRYKWLMVIASYKHIKKRIITTCSEYNSNPEITLYKKNNSNRDINNLEVLLSAMPGFIGKFYYPVATAGIVSQFYKTDYKSGLKRMNNPMAIVRLNNIFRLPDNYMLSANFNYRSDFDSENIHMRQSWQIDLSASKTFDNHWEVKLSFNDIFNAARKSSFIIYSGMCNVENVRYNTVRTVELTVGYKFNTTKSKYKGKGAGNSEKERL